MFNFFMGIRFLQKEGHSTMNVPLIYNYLSWANLTNFPL